MITARQLLRAEAFARLDALRLNEIPDLTWTKIASLADTSVAYARLWAKERGYADLMLRLSRAISVDDLPSDYPKIIELYHQVPRLSIKEIAIETNIPLHRTQATIRNLIELGFLTHRPFLGVGSSTITEAQLARLHSIAKGREAQETWQQIADRLGISRQGVRQFWDRFKHLLPQSSERPQCVGGGRE